MGCGGACDSSFEVIALIDCNSFYCSCEQVFRPDLLHRAVVVLSNNDGCVIARNRQAKAIGIPMGAPYHQYEAALKQNNAAVFSANFPLYANFSNRIMNILNSFSDQVEVYSIDEAFISLDGHSTDVIAYCKVIRETVLKWTGIPVSIGIAPTKVLAKCANKLAKQFPESNGVFALTHTSLIDSALKHIDVDDIWGIGRKQAQKLKKRHIHTAYEFKVWNNRALMLSLLSKTGVQLHDELNGIACIAFQLTPEPRKSIRSSRSFKPELSHVDDIAAALSLFTTRAMEKLRKQHSMTQMITVFIQSNPFKAHVPTVRKAQSFGLLTATNDTIVVAKYARQLLHHLHEPGIPIKKVGIILDELTSEDALQDSLFETANANPLMTVMDQINHRFGRDTIHVANHQRFLAKRRAPQWVSPQYTTKWEELRCV